MAYEPIPQGVIEEFLEGGKFRTSTQYVLDMSCYCALVLVDGNIISWRGMENHLPHLIIGSEIYVHPLNPRYWTTRDQCISVGLTTI